MCYENRSPEEYLSVFCDYMNKKASSLGMKNSLFKDPAGIKNLSSAEDILCCLLKLHESEIVSQIWGNKEYHLNIEGKNPRSLTITSKTLAGTGSNYLTDHYNVIYGKGGTLNIPRIYNTAVIVEAPDHNKQIACVVMGADAPNEEPNNRFSAAKDAIDIALGLKSKNEYLCAKSAIVCTVANSSDTPPTPLFEKNPAEVIKPASMSKMLTALITLEFVDDLDTKITVTEDDVKAVPPGYYQRYLKEGDTLCTKDMLAALLLPSSNLAGYVLGRFVGKIISDRK